MKVVLAAEAVHDLEAIGDYIALDNPARARSFVAELIDKAYGLATLPLAFPLVQGYAIKASADARTAIMPSSTGSNAGAFR